MDTLTREQVAATRGLDDWQYVADTLRAQFRLDSFEAGGAFVARLARAADEAGHHPDLDLRYPGVVAVLLTTHSAGGVTDRDVELALRCSELAARAGARATGPGD